MSSTRAVAAAPHDPLNGLARKRIGARCLTGSSVHGIKEKKVAINKQVM